MGRVPAWAVSNPIPDAAFSDGGAGFLGYVEAAGRRGGTPAGCKRGTAWIRSYVSGKACDYEIEIQRVDYSPSRENKSLVFQVTDERLLRLTGGIVQGMSGSPILQNGKLVGAVTHVFVQDSTRGYGIFVEDMIKK